MLTEYRTLPELKKFFNQKSLPTPSKVFSIVDKSAIAFQKILADKTNPQREVIKAAMQAGTRAHVAIEKDKAFEKDLLNEAVLETFHRDFSPIIEETWAKEKGVLYPNMYAGKFDSTGIMEGIPTLWDYKKTNMKKYKSSMTTYFKQLAAYLKAHNEIYEVSVNQVAILNIFGKTPETVGSQVIKLNSEELEYYTGLFEKDLVNYTKIINQQYE